jgi:hypothetical protein
MNEIQIIQQQLATERLHFAQVVAACSGSLGNATLTGAGEFARACDDYFAFAVGRFDAGSQAAVKLAVTGNAGPAEVEPAWSEFLRAFNEDARRHFAGLDARLTKSAPVAQWRALSRIDADSIFAERALYERVKATLPAGITLAALAAFLP